MRYKLVRLSYQYAEVEASICKIAIYTLKIYCLNLKFSKKLKPLARLYQMEYMKSKITFLLMNGSYDLLIKFTEY